MAEPLVLALDGSTRVCSAALLRIGEGRVQSCRRSEDDWQVVARRAETDGRGQAKVLMRLVDEMLGEWDPGRAAWARSWSASVQAPSRGCG